jgi:hypothetical protein
MRADWPLPTWGGISRIGLTAAWGRHGNPALGPSGFDASESRQYGLAPMTSSRTLAAVVVAVLMGGGCFLTRIPDISFSEAAEIISRAPEFNRYARLVKVRKS